MKNLNNKILIGVLAGLLVVFALSRIFRSSRLQRSLPETLVQVDTAKVDAIRLHPVAESGAALEFSKKGNTWTVAKGNIQADVEKHVIETVLSYFVRMTPQKLVSTKKERWSEFAVGDSSTRVAVLSGGKTVAELFIGRTGFSQSATSPNPYGMGGFGASFTYVRNVGDNEVYSVDGFLESAFNRSFDDWRNKSLLKLKSSEVTRIQFNYPDSGFVAEKKNGRWVVNDLPADSVRIKEYLSGLEFKNGSSFADDFNSSSVPDLSLVINGSKGELASVKAWKREADFVLNSSLQPKVYFSSASTSLVSTLFPGKAALAARK